MIRFKLRPQYFLITLFCVFLTAASCKETAIVHDLNERDANEILVILSKHNIIAKKERVEKNQEVTWFVNVNPEDEMAARSILVANNLPKIRQGGLSGICKDAGLILTPKTEKCREILAYKGEIINSLESIPGVVSADVVLNIPDKEDFPDPNVAQPRPTASVTLQYLKDAHTTTTLNEGKIQEFVSNAVTGLDARDVTVILSFLETGTTPPSNTETVKTESPVDSADQGDEIANPDDSVAQDNESELTEDDGLTGEIINIGGLKMEGASAKKFKVVVVLFLCLFLLLTVAFIFVLLRMSRLKKRAATTAVVKADDSNLIEA